MYSSSASPSIAQALRRRPLTTLGVTVTGGIVAYAHALEWRTNRLEQRGRSSVLPRVYNRRALHEYWNHRPVTVFKRLVSVVYELGPCLGTYVLEFKLFPSTDMGVVERRQKEQAIKFRQALTTLGPAYVKGGQQLSIRPDLVSPIVLKELQKLCDAVKPVNNEVAMQVLREELGCRDLTTIFEDLRLVASASLGQVYKAKLKSSGDEVAIKVQRPGIIQSFSLDLYLLQNLGNFLDIVFTTFTRQHPYHYDLFECFSEGSYSELDYENEASNQKRFLSELAKRKVPVKIPAVFEAYTTRRILTSEWIDGIKLASAPKERIRQMIPAGVELFLTQLLDIGAFHADPHPANLYVTNDGQLCLLDFGLVAEVDEKARSAMTKAIVHLLQGDFDSLIEQDAKELGFLPEDLNTDELKPILKKILTKGVLEAGSNLHERKRKLMDISNELNDVFFRYPFSVPAFFALVTRGLGLLEGIALTGDPDFDIFQASLPYASRRAVAILGSRGFSRLRTKYL